MPDQARRILLLGAGGQVGHELQKVLGDVGHLTALDRSDLDLRDASALRAVLRRVHPGVIVNAAAYTAVDRAESDEAAAFDVNATAPGVIAEEAASLGACVVHYSTDYVFDGHGTTPFSEEDRPNPLSVYGRSKLAGERAVASACARHVIFRTSWVFGQHGSNFPKSILRLALERDRLRVVSDQWGAPTSAETIARTTAIYLERCLSDHAAPPAWGLYHLAAEGEISWDGYARFVLECARRNGRPLRLSPDSIEAITTSEYGAPAPRPANSRLDTSKLRSALGITFPDWRRDVDAVVRGLCP